MQHSFVLVHSPLIGPYSWMPVRNVLAALGHRVVVPSLLPVLRRRSGFASSIAECVAYELQKTAIPGPLLLVGHSAAGAYLPIIATQLQSGTCAYLFVDARLPRDDASLLDQDPPGMGEQLRQMAQGGLLPPWSEWFDAELMKQAIPDDAVREYFLAELLPVPLALFEETLRIPTDWPDAPCGYIRLSEFYEALAEKASVRGWPVVEIDAEHLHLLTEPREVANLILESLHQLDSE
jgi:hypothetical protein